MRIQIALNTNRVSIISTSSPKLVEQEYTGTRGLYSAAVPDEQSGLFIAEIARKVGFTLDPSKIHVTIMYSEVGPKEKPGCNPNVYHMAYADKVQWWAGHDNKGYVSLALQSDNLTEEHERLKSLGCKPTFSPYQPHVTLWAGVEMSDKLKERMTKALEGTSKQELRFLNQFIGDLD